MFFLKQRWVYPWLLEEILMFFVTCMNEKVGGNDHNRQDFN